MDIEADIKTRVTLIPTAKPIAAGVDCLVVIYSPVHTQLGKRYLLDRPVLTIGRSGDNDVVLVSDSVSRQHARIERRGNETFSVDLNSTNGTYLNDGAQRVELHRLSPGDRIKVGDTILKFLSGSDVEAQYHEIIFGMTITDGLTNLFNRKQLDAALVEEITRAQRHQRALSVLMFDIDHFKRVNDTYGHIAGDVVLRGLAALLQKRVRPTDKLGRYGGEEFCAILPDTPLASAVQLAEELRKYVAAQKYRLDQRELGVTMSVGACSWQAGMQALDLYRRADEMLYQAKRSGRNCVCS